MRRLMFALVAGLCVAGSGTAQPRPGGSDRGPGPNPGRPDGPDVRKLEAEMEKLSTQLKEVEARLARMQRAEAPKDGPGGDRRGDRGPGPGGDRPRAGGPGGDRPGFGGGRGPGPGASGFQGFGRFGPDGPRGPGGDRGPGRPGGDGPGRGPGAGGPPDMGRRLDHIINELEQLKKDLDAQRR